MKKIKSIETTEREKKNTHPAFLLTRSPAAPAPPARTPQWRPAPQPAARGAPPPPAAGSSPPARGPSGKRRKSRTFSRTRW